MEDFVQKNPQEIKQELDALSELMAEEQIGRAHV